MTRLRLATTFAGAVLLSITSGAAFGRTSCDPIENIEVAQSHTPQSTSAIGFVNVKSALVKFSIEGSESSCLLVNFSASVLAGPGSGGMQVKAVRDHDIESVDGAIPFVSQGADTFGAHAYSFLFTDVPPGAHIVQMQFNSGGQGDPVTIGAFNMVVQHR